MEHYSVDTLTVARMSCQFFIGFHNEVWKSDNYS